MREPTERERLVGRFLRERFGRDTSVFRYGDDSGGFDLFIVSGRDCPADGVTSYGTAGLSEYPIPYGDTIVNVELVGACATAVPDFPEALSSCAFEYIKNGTPVVFGGVIRNILDQYGLSRTLRHIIFLTPFLWEGLEATDFLGTTTHWLLAVPISDAELAFLVANGVDALEALFERARIDLFDIDRPSAA